jgi:patatin-like phospholipase/acyl hydrolase
MKLRDRLKRSTVRVLAIDGGGIRGIVPAMVLARIEEKLARRHRKKQLCGAFEVMAGTSTGSLIVLGLATPRSGSGARRAKEAVFSAGELVTLYREKGALIFPPRRYPLRTNLLKAFKHKYDDENLRSLLNDVFQGATLKEALTNVLVTSYDTETREPRFFKKRPPLSEYEDDLNFYVKDVARAAIAAPAYFAPACISSLPDSGRRFSLIDGGIFANNPALSAYIEARKIYPQAARYLVLSLGTGVAEKSYTYEEVRSWGYMDWMSPFKGLPLLDMMMDGQSDSTNHMLARLPGVELYRLDFRLEEKHRFMDDASEENIAYLMDAGRNLLSQEEERIEEVCRRL